MSDIIQFPPIPDEEWEKIKEMFSKMSPEEQEEFINPKCVWFIGERIKDE